MDRNSTMQIVIIVVDTSLSARRAWIEIGVDFAEDWLNAVALRKESVDRNNIRIASIDSIIESLSARRAWIEMDVTAKTGLFTSMSLSARRAWIEIGLFGADTLSH